MGRAGLAAGVPNDNVFVAPNAGADVVAAGAADATGCAPNERVELVVAGVPNDKGALAAGVVPVNRNKYD